MYNPFAGLPISCDWGCHRARGSAGGIDYGVSVGYPVRASFTGSLRNVSNSAGGNIAILTRADGLMFMHMHLSRFVTPGHYNEGDIIGYSGGKKGAPGAGNSTGPHLHVNAMVGNSVRNPYDYWTTGTRSNRKKRNKLFGFIRNPAGEISIVNPATGKRRALSLGEWSGYSANGASYAQLTEADYNAVPKE